VIILPVSVTYDRIFEMNNLATEMVSGEVDGLSFLGVLDKLHKMKKDQLGRIFVQYGEPLSVRDYLQSQTFSPLNSANLSVASLKLSQDLIREM
jgi:glycerol-3-phosphate O-acyltransferase